MTSRGGGRYVAAQLYSVPSGLSPAAIGFRVKSPTNILISLRVQDSSGQTLQYDLNRPFETTDPNAWYQQVVPLNTADFWYGGTNSGQPVYPLTSISVLAGGAFITNTVGAIDFDNVTAISSTLFALNPAQQPFIPALPGSGLLLPRLAVNIHFTSDDALLNAAQGAGFSWVRMDLTWGYIEKTKGVYNWSDYDRLVNSARSRGMNVLYILDYGNPLYTGASVKDPIYLPPTNAAGIQAFANFAYAAAKHFAGKGVRFEIWNEPNITQFWPPTNNSSIYVANSSLYVALAQSAIARVHQGDSNALVTTAGISGFDFSFFTNVLRNASGGANAIGVHPYDCYIPEMLSDRMLYLRAMIAQYLTNVPPIWDTEWGMFSCVYDKNNSRSPAALKRQAVFVARELLCADAAGLPFITYYDIRDDDPNLPDDPDSNFGLLAHDYTDKPAMTAVKTLTSVARSHRFSGFIHTQPSNLTAMRFDGRTNIVVALWSSTPAGQVTVTVPTNTTATDFLGNPLTLMNWTNQLAWTVYESNGPVYLTFPYTWQATNLAPVLAPVSNQTLIAGGTHRTYTGVFTRCGTERHLPSRED